MTDNARGDQKRKNTEKTERWTMRVEWREVNKEGKGERSGERDSRRERERERARETFFDQFLVSVSVTFQKRILKIWSNLRRSNRIDNV